LKKGVFSSIFIVAVSMLHSDIITLKGEKRDIQLLRDDTFQRSLKSEDSRGVYYLYGIKRNGTKVTSNNTLIIKLKDGINPERFAEENSLKLIRRNSTGTYIFKNLSNEDVVLVSNRLKTLPSIISVSPNWRRVRGLK